MKDNQNKNAFDSGRDIEGGNPAIAVRPQKPKDAFGFGGGTFTPGRAPFGGFQAVWNFDGNPKNYKSSPTGKPEKGSV